MYTKLVEEYLELRFDKMTPVERELLNWRIITESGRDKFYKNGAMVCDIPITSYNQNIETLSELIGMEIPWRSFRIEQVDEQYNIHRKVAKVMKS